MILLAWRTIIFIERLNGLRLKVNFLVEFSLRVSMHISIHDPVRPTAYETILLAFRHSQKLIAHTVTSLAEKSSALPFLEAPPNTAGYIGDVGFDPFRFSDFVPVDFLREAELKHGRIAMMAWLGFVAVDCGLRVYPIPDAYEGLTAVTAHDALVEQGGLAQMLLWFSLAEVVDTIAVMQMLNGSGRAPGDFGLDPLSFLKGKSEAEIEDMKLKEITHCRLGMIAFSGVVTQAVLTQGPFPYV